MPFKRKILRRRIFSARCRLRLTTALHFYRTISVSDNVRQKYWLQSYFLQSLYSNNKNILVEALSCVTNIFRNENLTERCVVLVSRCSRWPADQSWIGDAPYSVVYSVAYSLIARRPGRSFSCRSGVQYRRSWLVVYRIGYRLLLFCLWCDVLSAWSIMQEALMVAFLVLADMSQCQSLYRHRQRLVERT